MKFRPFIISLPLCAGLLSGCFGGGGPGEWEDPRYATMMEAADSVFKLGYIKQAQQQYASALDRAFLIDDPRAIHDAGFNLATSELRLKDYKASLATLKRVSDALTVRGWTTAQQADLHLVRASVFYGQKYWQGTEDEAGLAKNSTDEGIRLKAYAMSGFAAFELFDRATLEDAISHFTADRKARNQADLKELLVCRFMMDQNWPQAADGARALVKIREEEMDYEAMRRALLLEARALRATGQQNAADDAMKQFTDSDKAAQAAQ